MVYDAFIYNSEASFSQDEIGTKVLRREPKLFVRENIHIAVSSTFAEIFDIHGSQWSARFMTYSSNFSYDDWLTLIDEGKENGSFGFGSNRKLKLPAGLLGLAFESEMERLFGSSMLKQIPMNLDLNRNRTEAHSHSHSHSSTFTLCGGGFEMVRRKREPTHEELELQVEFEERKREKKVWLKRVKNDSRFNGVGFTDGRRKRQTKGSNLLSFWSLLCCTKYPQTLHYFHPCHFRCYLFIFLGPVSK